MPSVACVASPCKLSRLDYALLEQRPGRTLRASSNREIGVPKFLCIAGTCAALAITVVPAANARAAEIGGVTLPPTITYSDKQLALAGCGTREISVFFVGIDLYVISLYLPTPTTDVATILAPGTAKLVRLNVVYDGSMPDSLPDEWRTRIEDAVSAEMLRTLQGFYKRIRSGDVVTVGYAGQRHHASHQRRGRRLSVGKRPDRHHAENLDRGQSHLGQSQALAAQGLLPLTRVWPRPATDGMKPASRRRAH